VEGYLPQASEVLLIAVGNVLRRDDGVAHWVLAKLELKPDEHAIEVQQLTPELALALASYRAVVFIDAAVDRSEVTLEPVAILGKPPTLSHVFSPEALIALASACGFRGEAWVCRIPVTDLGLGEGLSPQAQAHAEAATELLRRLLTEWRQRRK